MSSPHFFLLCSALLAADPSTDFPSTPSSVVAEPTSITVEQLVQAALRHEMEQNPSERDRLLRIALLKDSNYSPAHWHLGQVEFKDQWISPSEVSATVTQDSSFAKYLQVRQRYADRPQEHFDLARWCQAHDLTMQHRAHLLTAAHLEPNYPLWQQALGRSLHDGRWMTDEEIQDANRRREQYLASYKQWKPKLHRCRREFQRADEKRTPYEIQSALANVDDPLVIPVLEEVFSLHQETTALIAIEVLRRMAHQDATHSLVRHAVWSEWLSVRQQAIDELKNRDPNQFMPLLIEYLRPAHSKENWLRLGSGLSAGVWVIQDFDASYFDVAVSVPSLNAVRGNAVSPDRRDAELQSQFAIVDSRNQNRLENAVTALREITGADLESNQEDWRRWWANVNHYFYQFSESDQPTRRTRTRTRFVTSTPEFVRGLGSCFEAGTLVWTLQGILPIDQIQRGDLVLSSDPDTGELAYRAVVDRTIRPRTEITNLKVNGETLGATLGHPIWVSGKGWVKVKDLESGDSLRGCGEIHALDSATEGEPAMAYNLVVEGFHTYFVGESKILVHDNTPITDSLLKVPGLKLNIDSENQTIGVTD